MTKETCGLAVVDDQLTLVTDVILDKGIEAVTDIARTHSVERELC